ncbi:hypothetical protein [Amycolatopsis sp. CA-128772]|nr:hypothetical protein [Amycolatopsis sp. CA-128772]
MRQVVAYASVAGADLDAMLRGWFEEHGGQAARRMITNVRIREGSALPIG